jgi:hypothetical protein
MPIEYAKNPASAKKPPIEASKILDILPEHFSHCHARNSRRSYQLLKKHASVEFREQIPR